MEIDPDFVIFDCKRGRNTLLIGGAIVSSNAPLHSIMSFWNYDLKSNYTAIHSILNNRMWMVHDQANCTRLAYECEKLGKPPPLPKFIIDTSLFTSSKTKLGRAAALLGLGTNNNGFIGNISNHKPNLSAILACTEIMSKLDVPVETLNGTVHPMIYYLMQYNDQMKDEVRARYFNEAEYPSSNKIDDLQKELNYELDHQKENVYFPGDSDDEEEEEDFLRTCKRAKEERAKEERAKETPDS